MYKNFQEKIGDIDRRMATIVCQGFDDCSGLESTFKVTQSETFLSSVSLSIIDSEVLILFQVNCETFRQLQQVLIYIETAILTASF